MARQTVYLDDVETGANHAPRAIDAMLDEGFVCQLGPERRERPERPEQPDRPELRGPQGPQGEPGAAGTGPIQLDTNTNTCSANSLSQFNCSVDCDPGWKLTGGGGWPDNGIDNEQLVGSRPLDTNTWQMRLQKYNGMTSVLTVYVICTPA